MFARPYTIYKGFFPSRREGGAGGGEALTLSDIYAIALSRLGISVREFDDLTPYELDKALSDHSDYHFAYIKQLMNLNRFVGTVLRNKGLKTAQQIIQPERFYRFWWEEKKEVHVPTPDEWKKLDKRYLRPAR